MARTATGQVVERDGSRGTTYALRFRAYGERHYMTLGSREEGWTRKRAETELQNILADVRRGSWKPPKVEPVATPRPDPTFHEFASEWLASRRDELAARTVEDYTLALTHHLLPFFAEYRLAAITAREVDRYKASKLRAREQLLVQRPLSNRTINKHLIRLGQILDAAVRYELLECNPVKTRVKKLKEAEPRRARMTGEQVQVLLRAAGPNRVLLATAIMAVQMGHRDPRMTLRVYTDVSAVRPKTRLGGVLGDTDWAQMGTNAAEGPDLLPRAPTGAQRETGPLGATSPYGSDGTRTRDLRRDRPAL
jgi:integrase-like protein